MILKDQSSVISELSLDEIQAVSGGHDWGSYADTAIKVTAVAIAVWSAYKSHKN